MHLESVELANRRNHLGEIVEKYVWKNYEAFRERDAELLFAINRAFQIGSVPEELYIAAALRQSEGARPPCFGVPMYKYMTNLERYIKNVTRAFPDSDVLQAKCIDLVYETVNDKLTIGQYYAFTELSHCRTFKQAGARIAKLELVDKPISEEAVRKRIEAAFKIIFQAIDDSITQVRKAREQKT